MTSTNPHIVIIESALQALAEGEKTPSFKTPDGAALLAAIGAVLTSPQAVQIVGHAALLVLVQASKADAITERVFGQLPRKGPV